MKRDASPPINTKWLIDIALKKGVSLTEMRQFLMAHFEGEPSWNTLPASSYMLLFNWLAEQLDDQNLGIHLGLCVDIKSFGGGTAMVYHVHNIRDCCRCLAGYDHAISQDVAIQFIEGKEESRLEYKLFQSWGVDVRHDNEMSMQSLCVFLRSYLGADWLPSRLDFSHAAPADTDLHLKSFGHSFYFDQPVTALYFRPEELDVTVNDASPYLLDVLRNHADELLAESRRQDNVLTQVRYYVARSLGSDLCSVEDAADYLFMSRRSLARHLAAKGNSFRDIRNHIAMDMAKKALVSTSSNISEIALQLGYSETSAFDRAFKRLIGCSPKEYRYKAKPGLSGPTP